jgi:hypothetical protein
MQARWLIDLALEEPQGHFRPPWARSADQGGARGALKRCVFSKSPCEAQESRGDCSATEGEARGVVSLLGLDVADPGDEGILLELEGLELVQEMPGAHAVAVLLGPDEHAHEGPPFL